MPAPSRHCVSLIRRHTLLVDKKHSVGLQPWERVRLFKLQRALDKEWASYYKPLAKRLRRMCK